MITEEQIKNIVTEQDALNELVTKNWTDVRKEIEFRRACYVELAEAYDHLSFKWWKSGKVNLKEAQMELIDVLFFAMSKSILRSGVDGTIEILNTLNEAGNQPQNPNWFSELEVIDSLFNASIKKVTWFSELFSAMYRLEMTDEMIYNMYMGKLILNIFRQRNGYNKGTYKKIWDGVEDNVILSEIMKETQDVKKIEKLLSAAYARGK